MARPMKDFYKMYVNALRIDVIEDLEKQPKLLDILDVFKSKFIMWCAKQRVIYQNDIYDEVIEFEKKFIKSRLYNIDIKLWKKISKQVFKRDDYVCRYCKKRGGILEIDHILPVSVGGKNCLSNLVTSCRKCNRQKKDKSIEYFITQKQIESKVI